MTTSFDSSVRTIECSRCGAPVAAPQAGGRLPCRYCGTLNDINTRKADTEGRRPPSLADDVARLSRLKAQVEHPVSGHPYELDRPPVGWPFQPAGSTPDPQRLKAEWTAAKARAASARSPEEQRGLLWIALRLTDAKSAVGQRIEARALLETALDLLDDPGHRHIVRCRLAVEAVREGNLAASAGWLAECDPAPELLVLDSAYRSAKGTLLAAQRDFQGVIGLVGSSVGEIPVDRSHAPHLAALRVHAWEQLGQPDRARQALLGGPGVSLNAIVAVLEQSGLAPNTLRDQRRLDLDLLVMQRSGVRTGLAALAGPLGVLPLLAAAGLFLATMPRCFFDADPLLGTPGYALCPQLCSDCTGPWRVYTEWHHRGNKSSTDGPEYYCPSPTNRVLTMSDKELESNSGALSEYQLYVAPAASTWLMFLVLLVPVLPFLAWRSHAKARVEAARLDVRIAEAAVKLGFPAPAHGSPSLRPVLVSAAFVSITAFIAVCMIAIELAVR